jgi:sugar phosphate isomerase/epimerase
LPRQTGLEHLTLLSVSPPELVSIAAGAGFDAVGLRVSPVTADEPRWPMAPGSPLLARTRHRLADTGVTVLGVEAIRLTPRPAGYQTVLETAAELGARYVNAICEDPDLERLSDAFAALVAAAAPYGVRPLIEFMAYRSVRTLADAVAIAAGSGGGGILVDALHVQRCGVSLAGLNATDPRLFSYLQLCDGPLAAPADQLREARSGRLLPGDGQFPLPGLLAAMPADTAVAVVAPAGESGGPADELASRARARIAALIGSPSSSASQRSDDDVRTARGPRSDQTLRWRPGTARRHPARRGRRGTRLGRRQRRRQVHPAEDLVGGELADLRAGAARR